MAINDVRLHIPRFDFVASYDYPYVESLAYLKKALAIEEKTRKEDDPKLATTLNNLAGVYYIQGKFTEAEPLYQRSLAITEKTYGANHPAVASVLDNMVELYGNMGKGEQAEKLAKRAEKIRK